MCQATRLLFIASICLGGLALRPGASAAEEVLIDGIAAQVAGDIVLLSEVQQLARPIEERMREAGAPESEIQNMHSEALERLIEAKLIESVVHRLEMTATEADVDGAIAGIAQDTGLSIEQLERSVESHGLTVAEYRAKIKGEIERSKVLNAMVRSRIRVEPEEVRVVYQERYDNQKKGGEEVHLRHILVAFGPDSLRTEQSACAIAEDAREKVRSDAISFPDIAMRVTDMRPEQAGELGWFHVEDLAPWMTHALAGMQPGDVSEVIRTGFGCNLLELVERRTFTPVSFEEAEPAIINDLSRQKMDKEYLSWLESLRKQTYVSRKGLYSEAQRAKRALEASEGQ